MTRAFCFSSLQQTCLQTAIQVAWEIWTTLIWNPWLMDSMKPIEPMLTEPLLYSRNQFPLFYGKIVFQLESQLSLSWVELRRWWSNRMFQVYYHEITADWSRHKLVATLLMTSLSPSNRQGTNWVKIKCQFSVCLLGNSFQSCNSTQFFKTRVWLDS